MLTHEIRSTPLIAIPDEAPAKLVVDPPIPEQLALGRVFIQYRAEKPAHFARLRQSRPGRITARRTPSLLR
jgi:Family of unknown function (DUF6130)